MSILSPTNPYNLWSFVTIYRVYNRGSYSVFYIIHWTLLYQKARTPLTALCESKLHYILLYSLYQIFSETTNVCTFLNSVSNKRSGTTVLDTVVWRCSKVEIWVYKLEHAEEAWQRRPCPALILETYKMYQPRKKHTRTHTPRWRGLRLSFSSQQTGGEYFL